MSQESRDAISLTIDAELFAWLMDTAATATGENDVVDLYAGAVAGLARFLWAHRKPGTPIETIATTVAKDVTEFLRQAEEHERGGHA
jgi:hypothetical protein